MRSALGCAVSRRSRERKLAWFRRRIEPDATVLLIGASTAEGIGTENVVERGLAEHAHVHALVYESGDPGLDCPVTLGDARALPFPDASFDYVVSNAVIEHVGGPEGARAMVSEARRVARRSAIHTTPYRWFPVETHTQIPLLHWLPRRSQHWVFSVVGAKYFTPERYWLFDVRDLRALNDARCVVHRIGPVSLVAEWPPSTPAAAAEPVLSQAEEGSRAGGSSG